MQPFHLAFPVKDIAATRTFYTQMLRCKVGREDLRWIDFDFFGHQISAHLDESLENPCARNAVDEKAVPSRHFGMVLLWDQWDELLAHLKQQGMTFSIQPYTRFAGEVGEQRTFFIQDPSDNFLEFKCFREEQRVFANK
ncbi:VOC family protein [Gammaproteobacteria bacterium]|jgi:uncharacterized protein|nr:glyoxalase [Pseudomonadota bacterium]MDB0064353.1 VOC family protein [Gammaproteobacteria bacterium]